MAEVDSLTIAIGTSSDSAGKQVDELTTALENLKTKAKGGANLNAVNRQLDNLSQALEKVSQYITTLDKLKDMLIAAGTASSGLNAATAAMKEAGAAMKASGTSAKAAKADYSSLSSEIAKAASQFSKLPADTQKAVIAAAKAENSFRSLKSSNVSPTLDQTRAALYSLSTAATKSTSGIGKLTSALTGSKTQIESIKAAYASLPPSVQKAILSNAKLEASNTKTAKSFNLMGIRISSTIAKFGAYAAFFSRIAGAMGGWVNSANEYIENVNLFQVSMGEFYEQAFSYAELVSEKMGIDPSDWMRNQGVFMAMAKGFGLSEKKAYDLSESLTELSYDISSLYNEDVATSVQRLQSAFAGEIEPIRRLGISITQATLQEYALSKGIDEAVTTMTEQEKALLRTLKIIEDAGTIGAIGDFAKTLESPANAIRILKQQVTQLGRAFGTVLLPILTQVIPWIQAFVSILTDAIQALAVFVGFTMPEWDTNDWSQGLTDGSVEAEDALSGAAKAAKELKNATIGIDELNIISPPSAGSGSGSDGGISDWANDLEIPDLWDKQAIADIQTKADKVKETLEEIAGFVAGISAGLLTWSISKGFAKDIGIITRLLGALSVGVGITLLVDSIKDILVNGNLTWKNVVTGAGGGAIAGAGLGAMLAKKWGMKWAKGTLVGAGIGIGIALILEGVTAMTVAGINPGNALVTALGSVLSAGALSYIGLKKLTKGNIPGKAAFGIGAPIGLAFSIGAITYSGIKSGQFDYGGLENEVLTWITGAASAIGGYKIASTILAGTGIAGAAIGLSVGLIVSAIVSYEAYQANLVDEFWSSEIGEQIKALDAEIEAMQNNFSNIKISIDGITGEIDPEKLGNIEMAKNLIVDIFSINEKENLTAGELAVLESKVSILNSLGLDGLQIELDETGRIAGATKDQMLAMTDALLEQYKMEAMRESYIASWQKRYELEAEIAEATAFRTKQEALYNEALSEHNSLLADYEYITGLCMEQQSRAGHVSEILAEKQQELSDQVFKSSMSLEEQKRQLELTEQTLNDAGSALDTINTKIDFFESELEDVAIQSAATNEEIVENTGEMVDGMKNAINTGASGVKSAMNGVMQGALDTVTGYIYKFSSVGKNIVLGISSGISSSTSMVKSAVDKMVEDTLQSAKQKAEINSPSELFKEEVGKNIGYGVADGILETADYAASAIGSVIDTALSSFGGIEYDANIDYMALIDSAVAAGDMAEAGRLEAIRNAKIDGEGLDWSKTFDFQNLSESFEVEIDYMQTEYEVFSEDLKRQTSEYKTVFLDAFSEMQDITESFTHSAELMFKNMSSESVSGINAIISSLNSIPRSITTVHTVVTQTVSGGGASVNAFASGGFPDHGQMFIAREHGPELVGTIGNQTAVANNEQIIDGIRSGVEVANASQNALLMEQNELLRAILAKESGVVLDGKTLKKTLDRANKQSGVSIMAGGVMA